MEPVVNLPSADGGQICIGADEPDRDAVAVTYGAHEIRLTAEDARTLSTVLDALYRSDLPAVVSALKLAAYDIDRKGDFQW